MIYALFFYRAKITWRRIILAKLLTNIQNVLLGALWSAILYSKGYLYYLTQSAVKNALYLPLQILLLGFLFQAVLPAPALAPGAAAGRPPALVSDVFTNN